MVLIRGNLRLPFYLALCIVFILECIVQTRAVSVMSIDFGSEWMKIAIVSPGVPMEIALNKESKRKTPIAIAFRDEERTFGEDAMGVCVRFPKNCYVYLLDLLGKKVDNPIVKLFQQRFPYYDIVPDPDRGTVVFQHDSETTFSVEELVAMMISKAQEIAQNSAGQVINEAVITVPGFFNQAERRAMIQAAELAGIKVLQLINDYTAVALNYGIFRRKDFNETTQYIMLYDMGSSSTSATVVGYQVVKTKEKGYVESNPQLTILGVGYDRTLGGLDMQLRLRDYLGKKFNEMKKTKNDVFKNPRSLAKLFKEAGRLKNVLSANMEHFAQVEGLLDEVDFKLQVTRDEFENLCKDLFDRVQQPIETALKTSGLTMDVISQVILVGAGTRVPAVQERLTASVGMELGKNLNTDEAAVFGAVYKAADLSAGFKVKKFVTRDATLFPVQVTFEREGDSGAPKQMKRTLFGLMNPYPQKKILTFNKNLTDFEFHVVYGDIEYLGEKEISTIGTTHLSKVSLSGVASAVQKNVGPNTDVKGIKVHLNMDESGLLHLVNVELVVEKTIPEGGTEPEESPLSKLGSTISKLFTGPEETLKENIDKPEEKEESGETEKKGEKGPESNKTKEETEKDDKKAKEEAKPKPVVIREPIEAKEELLIVPSLDKQQLEQSNSKIAELNKKDESKRKHEGALNALESFVFEARNKLLTEEYQQASTPEEVKAVNDLCEKMSEWLDEEGFSADVDTLETKLTELKKVTKNIWSRVKEHQERPEALTALNSMLNVSQGFLMTIKNVTSQQADTPEGSVFTQVEIDGLEKMIKETLDWKEKAVLEQNSQPLSEHPKLTLKLIGEKMALLDQMVKYLVNKAKIWKAKLPDDKTKEKVNETQGTNTTQNTTEKVVPEPVEVPLDDKPEKSEEESSKPTEKTDETESEKKKHSEL
ncbi:hypoxia up-regulated protein 1 isoform X2 [Cimex lectularius]|uniref:Hypoxia up-regulated protein 1 n=1 Tax=Cimex lectularius TaxID=79782 RepID=A0A8I6S4A5_CIMLE|nr:hypoxia up-regulated protein 1 isoform X2 [Cimex lectularius]